MLSKHSIFFVFLLFFSVIQSIPLSAQEEITPLREGTLLIGVRTDLPPFMFQDAEKQPTGLFIDLIHLWSKKAGLQVELISMSEESAYHNLKSGNLDAILGVPKRDKHNNWISYSQTIYAYSSSAYTLRETPSVFCPDCKEFGKIGVLRDERSYHFLTKHYPLSHKVVFQKRFQLMNALLNEQIKAFIEIDPVADRLLRRYMNQKTILKLNPPLFSESQHIAVSKGNTSILEIINSGLKQIHLTDFIKLENKWLTPESSRYYQKNPEGINLTPEELEWIRTNKTVNIPIVNKPPFCFVDGSQPTGMAIEHIKMVLEKVHLQPKFMGHFTNMKQVLKSSNINDIHLLPAIDNSAKVNNRFTFTNEIFRYPVVLVTQRNSEFISSLKDLNGKTIAIHQDMPHIPSIHRQYPDIKLLIYQNTADALQAVATGQAQAFMGNLAMASFFIESTQFTHLKIAAPSGFPSQKIVIGINKADPVLASIISKALASMTDKDYEKLKKNWLKVTYEFGIRTIDIFYWVTGTVVTATLILIIILIWNKKLQHEIEERQQVEEKLYKAKQEAEQASRVKSEFLANISHEIRTPLNAILGFSDIMAQQETDKKKLQFLQAIDTSGKALLNLINELLDFTKVEAGRLELTIAEVHLPTLLNELQQLFYAKIYKKNLSLQIEYLENTPEFFLLDQTRLKQILINLIGNAIKFTEEGKVTIRIEFHPTEKDKGDLFIFVRDTGIGIKKDQKERIFRAFEQHKGQSPSRYGGSGLGLAISKNLAEAMNGSIRVESDYGKGSLFTLHLQKIVTSKSDLPAEKSTQVSFEQLLDAKNKTESLLQVAKPEKAPNKKEATNIKKLIEKLEQDYQDRWRIARETMNINDIEKWAQHSIQTGKEHHFLPIQKWGEQILEDIESFNIDQIANTIDTLPVLIENLKSRLN